MPPCFGSDAIAALPNIARHKIAAANARPLRMLLSLSGSAFLPWSCACFCGRPGRLRGGGIEGGGGGQLARMPRALAIRMTRFASERGGNRRYRQTLDARRFG